MIVFGVDPGSRTTGYGVIRISSSKYEAIDYGCIKPPLSLKASERYFIIFNALEELIAQHRPEVLVIETQYVGRNVKSALTLGLAKGLLIVLAGKKNIPLIEYAPTQPKLAVTGSGKASKWQVQARVKDLLDLEEIPQPEDAADALSLAICYAHQTKWNRSER